MTFDFDFPKSSDYRTKVSEENATGFIDSRVEPPLLDLCTPQPSLPIYTLNLISKAIYKRHSNRNIFSYSGSCNTRDANMKMRQ